MRPGAAQTALSWGKQGRGDSGVTGGGQAAIGYPSVRATSGKFISLLNVSYF